MKRKKTRLWTILASIVLIWLVLYWYLAPQPVPFKEYEPVWITTTHKLGPTYSVMLVHYKNGRGFDLFIVPNNLGFLMNDSEGVVVPAGAAKITDVVALWGK